MRITKITLENVCQHKNLDVEFESGLIGILGPNGVGKSNLLRMVEFLITGKMPGSLPIDDHVTWGEDTGMATIALEMDNGLECEISRTLGSSGWSFELGGRTFDNMTAGYEAFHRMLGATPNMLSTVAFVQQNKLTDFLFGSDSSRNHLFQRLFKTETAERDRRILAEAQSEFTPRRDSKSALEEVLKGLIEDKESLAALEGELAEINAALEDLDQEVVEKGKAEADRKRAATTAEINAETTLRIRKAKLEEAKKAKDELPESADTEKVEEAKKVVAKYEAEAPLRKQKEEAEKRVEELSNKEAEARTLVNKEISESLTSQIQYLQTHVAHLEQDETQFSRLLSAAGDKPYEFEIPVCPICDKDLSVSLGVCPVCGGELDEELDTQEIEEKKRRAVVDLKTARDLLSQKKKDLERREKAANALPDILDQLRSAKKSVAADLTKDVDYMSAQHIVNEASETEERGKKVEAELKYCEAALEDAQKAKEEAEKEWASIDEELIQKYNDTVGNIEELTSKRDRVSGSISQLKTGITAKESSLDTLREMVKKEKKIGTYLDGLEKAREVLHRDNLPALVARSRRADINAETEKFLTMFDVPFGAYLDENMAPMATLQSSDEPKPGAVLSWGERTALSVSFAVALWSLYLPEVSFLVMDEPTHHLNNDRVRKLADLLDSLRAYCKESRTQIFIVTHDKTLQRSFDQTIHLGD